MFNVNDRVYLATDPEREEGTVVAIQGAVVPTVFVRWDCGRTWGYNENDLFLCGYVQLPIVHA